MASAFRLWIAESINRLLAVVGLRLTRSSTMDRLLADQARAADLDALSSRIAALESRTDDEALNARIAALPSHMDDELVKNLISYAMKSHWRTVDLIEEMTPVPQEMTCALCAHTAPFSAFEKVESTCMFLGGRLIRYRCPECDVIFGPHKMLRLDEQMVDLEYRNLYRMYAEGNTTESTIRTFHLLDPKREGKYLDFGCGGEWSEAVARLRQEGWDIVGFEPSARNSSGHVLSKWEEIEQQRFDGILSHNVVEHLFDPAGSTGRLAKLLAPDGRIVHATACFDYLYEYSRFHVFFFTGRSPEILAQKAGMKIVNWVRDGEYIACVMEPIREPVRESASRSRI